VKVSVVTIKGTDCRVIELGQVADKTRGEVLNTISMGAGISVFRKFYNLPSIIMKLLIS
jgi:hypothetical protein